MCSFEVEAGSGRARRAAAVASSSASVCRARASAGDGSVSSSRSPFCPNAYRASRSATFSAGSVCVMRPPSREIWSAAPGDSDRNDSPSSPAVAIDAMVSLGSATFRSTAMSTSP